MPGPIQAWKGKPHLCSRERLLIHRRFPWQRIQNRYTLLVQLGKGVVRVSNVVVVAAVPVGDVVEPLVLVGGMAK